MPLTEIRAGRIGWLSGPPRDCCVRLADHCASFLRQQDSPYSVRIVVSPQYAPLFSHRLARKAGASRAARHRILDFLSTVQSLQHPSKPVTADILSRVEDLVLDHSSDGDGLPPSSPLDLDALVADSPDHPMSVAYCAGLAAMGYVHPYSRLWDASFAPSVSRVYVHNFDLLPSQAQQWLLASLCVGIDLFLTGRSSPACVNAHDPSSPSPSPGTSPVLNQAFETRHLCFPDKSSLLSAVQDAISDSSLDVVYCPDRSLLRAVEVYLLLNSVPFSTSGSFSLLNTVSFRVLVAYLDWVVDRSDAGLNVLLEMLGTSTAHWRAIARKHRYSYRLSIAAPRASVDDLDETTKSHLESLSAVIFSTGSDQSLASHLSFLNDWGTSHVSGFDSADIDVLMRGLSCSSFDITADRLRQLLYTSINAETPGCPALAPVSSRTLLDCERAWLVVEHPNSDQLDRSLSVLASSVERELVVSYVDAGDFNA